MAFRMRPDQPIEAECRRIADKQLQLAITGLEAAGGVDGDQRAHTARRHVKKIRALIRLVEPRLESGERHTQHGLRQASRGLATIADGEALLATITTIGAAIQGKCRRRRRPNCGVRWRSALPGSFAPRSSAAVCARSRDSSRQSGRASLRGRWNGSGLRRSPPAAAQRASRTSGHAPRARPADRTPVRHLATPGERPLVPDAVARGIHPRAAHRGTAAPRAARRCARRGTHGGRDPVAAGRRTLAAADPAYRSDLRRKAAALAPLVHDPTPPAFVAAVRRAWQSPDAASPSRVMTRWPRIA